MAWCLFLVPTTRRAELDAVLAQDVVSRQSLKVRDAGTAGGPIGELYVLVEGSDDGCRQAEAGLSAIGTRPKDAEAVYRRFKDEEDAASQGMGLFFTE